jgi:hypothetical protein
MRGGRPTVHGAQFIIHNSQLWDVGVGLVGDDEVLSLEAWAYVVVSEAVFPCCGFTFER